MRFTPIVVVATALLFHRPAHAQTADQAPPAEDLLVTATRVPTAIADISAGVSVIDRATMDARGDATVAEALSDVPGAQSVPYGGPGNASLFLRGANSNQVQVLIDGVPVNDSSGPGGAYNFGVETLSDIARIEVVRGPMSAVYGSGAIGGVVNIITDHGAGPPRADLTLAAGLPAAALGTAALRGARGAFDYSLSAESQSQLGFDATPRRESVHTGERDGFRTEVGALDLGYTPAAGTRAFVDLRGRGSVYGYDDVNYPAFDDPNETARDNDLFVRAGLTSAPLGDRWRTALLISHDQEYRRYVNLLDANDPNMAAEDSRYVGLRTDVQWNNTILLPHGVMLTAGYEHAEEGARQRLNSISGGFPYRASVSADRQRDAGYVGLQGTILDRLTLDANVRDDATSGLGGAVTWRVGGSYALPAIASHLKASAGSAYLAPSLFDRFGVDSDGYIGNPALRPERSEGYEIGWSSDLARGAARLTVTWFHTHVNDLIETLFTPVYTSVNIDAARLQGVETALHLRATAWAEADATYTYTDARDAGTGAELLRRPYDSGSLTLTVRPTPMLSMVPQVTWAGGDRDSLVDDAGFPAGDGRNGGGAILNVNVAWQIWPALRVFAWARNVTNARWEAASGYAQPGPSILVGVHIMQ